MNHSRHNTWHADQRVNAPEANTDTPQAGGADDAFAQGFISSREAEHSTVPICNAFMDFSTGMIGQTWIVHFEPQTVEHVGNTHGRGLLPVHPNGQSLDTTKEKEAVERCKRVSNGVDHECHLLKTEPPRQRPSSMDT